MLSRPGDLITIGDVTLEVVRPAVPCRILDDAIGPGAADAMRGLAGSHCRVLTAGRIDVGAEVEFLPIETRSAGRVSASNS